MSYSYQLSEKDKQEYLQNLDKLREWVEAERAKGFKMQALAGRVGISRSKFYALLQTAKSGTAPQKQAPEPSPVRLEETA